jgi:hypothetical protein
MPHVISVVSIACMEFIDAIKKVSRINKYVFISLIDGFEGLLLLFVFANKGVYG